MSNLFVRFRPSDKLQAELSKDINRKIRTNAKPSQQAIDSYYTFVARSYEKALKRQLEGVDGKGFAFGHLHRSIKARISRSDTSMQGLSWGSGNTLIIPISAQFDMNVYGYAVGDEDGRRPSFAPITEIIQWIYQKKMAGTLRASVNKRKDVVDFAFKISQKWQDFGHEATLPNWWNIRKSSFLQRDFFQIYDGSMKYHIQKMSNSIIANINKRNKLK